ncbi:MAG: 2-amino-4-hydroxy-6-hydroxymethyldihydropteridine diphosphokinase [bacterium]|nr:2-amino-4-hydroxy-6-hydroxymethyldihydropteridine diphosphokinase [bacterium]
MSLVYIGLGTNLGDRYKNLEAAAACINRDPGIEIIKLSSQKETAPVDYLAQPFFLNQVILAKTAYEPEELLSILQKIEKELGKEVLFPKGPRIIDLDILLYDSIVYTSDRLTIPHPEIKNRAFIIEHLLELNPNLPL